MKHYLFLIIFLISLDLQAVLLKYRDRTIQSYIYHSNNTPFWKQEGAIDFYYYDYTSTASQGPAYVGYYFQFKTSYKAVAACPTGQSPIILLGKEVCGVPVTCPDGQHASAENTCVENTCAYYTGNETGCHDFGCKYYPDKTCLSSDDYVLNLFKDPNAKLFGSIAVGGLLLSPLGWLAGSAGLVSTMAGAGVVTTGILSTGGGLYGLVASLSPDEKISNDSSSAPAKSIRIDLKDYKVSPAPEVSGKTATVTDPKTGKVLSATTLPDKVIEQLSDSSNINPNTQEFINPIDMTGTQEIEYDYEENIAIVKTQTSPTTKTTQKTSFSVSQNSDGSVLTVPNTPIAPTVSGSQGGQVIRSQIISASFSSGAGDANTSSPSGSSPSGSDSKDYTAVLNDIKTNTSAIKDSLNVDSSVLDSSVDDGSGMFGNFDTQVKDSFGGFVYSDPLGISSIGSGQNVPTYSFSLMGQTFVLFDQKLFNSLPVELIKSILLFVAAISGFLTVISFGI